VLDGWLGQLAALHLFVLVDSTRLCVESRSGRRVGYSRAVVNGPKAALGHGEWSWCRLGAGKLRPNVVI